MLMICCLKKAVNKAGKRDLNTTQHSYFEYRRGDNNGQNGSVD